MSSGDYLDRLARRAAQASLDALPPDTVAAARLVLLDTLGAMLAGSTQPENRRLAQLASARAPQGTATLIGHGRRADATWASLSNAAAGVALEVDEGNRHGGGHPAIHVIPAALAVAEERRASGRALLEATIAGYEVSSRIGGATTVRPNVHSHGTWGTIGTAVAVARLGGAGAAEIRAAVNLAASMSPANTWTPALEGATIRNLYPGRAAWQGILAVDLLGCGFTGLEDAPSDVYGTILADAFDPVAAVAELESGWRIQQNYFKLHACCRYNHYALEALGTLQRRDGLRAEQVAGVHVTTIPFGVRMASPTPASLLAAKFSIPWAVAAALVRGHAGLDAFDAGALGDARIRELAGRVTVAADPAMTPRRADQPTARLRVTLADGRALEAEASVVRGDHAAPVPAAEVIDKFLALASPVLGAERARAAADCALVADGLKDVRDLTALLTT